MNENKDKRQEYTIYDENNNVVCTMTETHAFVEDWCKALHYRAELVDITDMGQRIKGLVSRIEELEKCVLELYLGRTFTPSNDTCKQLLLNKLLSEEMSYDSLSPELQEWIKPALKEAGAWYL